MSLAVLDKTKIRHSFAAAAESYDAAALLQRQVGLALLQKFPLQSAPGWVLDVGCGTGFLTRRLAFNSFSQPCLALDIALPMLQASRRNNGAVPVEYVCADAEKLPFADQSLQQVYSNLALQWCQNLPALFADVRRLLKPDGQLVFSTFGPATLHELKAAWSGVDDFAHVNDFYSVEEIRGFLQAAGLGRIEMDAAMYRLSYPAVLALMRELKDLGAHNVSLARNRRLTTRSQLQQMIRQYEKNMINGEISASYEIIFVRASL
jgi:malonyl-CoA O-methyltransferase